MYNLSAEQLQGDTILASTLIDTFSLIHVEKHRHTIDKDGVYIHWKTQKVAYRGPVLEACVHRVSENGADTLLTHCWALQTRDHEHHPEMHQHTALIVVAGWGENKFTLNL